MIKFRVWDGEEMCYPPDEENPFFPFFLGMGGVVWNICRVKGDGEVGIRRTNTVAMFWTGLQDKNGKDIYQGDILNYLLGTGVLRKAAVTDVEGGCWRFSVPEYGTPFRLGDCAMDRYAVAGNVHEHPELLK